MNRRDAKLNTPNDQERIEQMLAELYAIDPTLAQYKGDLPKVLAALHEHMPEVVVDPEFAAQLRAQVLAEAQHRSIEAIDSSHALKARRTWMSWMAPLAPMAVAVLLLLIVVPPMLHAPEEVNDGINMTGITLPETPQPEEMGMMQMRFDDSLATEGVEVFMPLVVAPIVPGREVVIEEAFVPAEGTILVREDADATPGSVLGESEVLEPGTATDVSITLSRALVAGEVVWIGVYRPRAPREVDAPRSVQIDPSTGGMLEQMFPVSEQP